MKKLFILLLLLTGLRAGATHIVGGEFELKHFSGSSYDLSLNMYFDDVNGSPGALDQSINVSIFSKATNFRIMDITLGLIDQTFVPYTSVDCAIGSLRTKKILYSATIQLTPQSFSSPAGYYVAWERCCRNNTIDNIINPGAAGQTFYMEFPPVVKNGQPFINSSPTLFPPLSDYACINQLFYFDFAGSDDDNDSLTYEMVTPLNGFSGAGNAMPLAMPEPYPEIIWKPGFGPNAQITGTPAININRTTGQLLLRPDKTGLFVFGIKCSEFRNGVKIGEVRRDFQLLVISCPTNNQPAIQVKAPGKNNFYQPQDTIRISPSGNRCVNVFLTDTDPNERLTFNLRPLNFTSPLPVLNNTTGIVNSGTGPDTLNATLCFPNCFDTGNTPYRMELIVSDDGCSLPKKDTTLLTVIVEPKPDQGPVISINPNTQVLRPKVGQTLTFNVTGQDADNDVVTVTGQGRNFILSSQSIKFSQASGAGNVTTPFSWKINCNSIRNTPYLVDFIVSSVACGITKTDSVSVMIDPVYNNDPPVLTPVLSDTVVVELPYNKLFTLDLTGTDINRDWLSLTASGDGFSQNLGMKFEPVSQDSGRVTGRFSWTPTCEAVKAGDITVQFSLDETTCQPVPVRRSLTFRVPSPDTVTFIPPNIFTPNNDNLNDFFEMPTLPPDLCDEVFSSIKIYNRWGSKVYQSSDRNFKWDGKDVSAGVYYYLIRFREKTYKGTVTIVE